MKTNVKRLVRVKDNSYAVDLTTGKQSWIAGTGILPAQTVTVVSKPFPYVVDSPTISTLHEMILVKDDMDHIHLVLNDTRTI